MKIRYMTMKERYDNAKKPAKVFYCPHCGTSDYAMVLTRIVKTKPQKIIYCSECLQFIQIGLIED